MERVISEYHHKFCEYKGHIGRIYYWGVMNIHLFYNFETGEKQNVDVSDVSFMISEDFWKIYKLKNYPDKFFNNEISQYSEGHYYKSSEFSGVHTDRQKQYGLIHDNVINLDCDGTNGWWTNNFSRLISHIKSLVEMHKDPDFEEYSKNKVWGTPIVERFINDYSIGPNSVYSLWCDKTIRNAHGVSDEEVIELFKEKEKFLTEKSFSIMLASCKEEYEYFMKKLNKTN